MQIALDNEEVDQYRFILYKKRKAREGEEATKRKRRKRRETCKRGFPKQMQIALDNEEVAQYPTKRGNVREKRILVNVHSLLFLNKKLKKINGRRKIFLLCKIGYAVQEIGKLSEKLGEKYGKTEEEKKNWLWVVRTPSALTVRFRRPNRDIVQEVRKESK
jgi:hypothetical protein